MFHFGAVFFQNFKEFSMKKIIKLIGLVILVTAIAFAMTTCDNNGGGGNNDGDITGGGDTLTISYPVDTNGITATDFSYTDGIVLSNLITGTPSVKISGSKVNISLGVPKSSTMRTFKPELAAIAIPSNTKGFQIEWLHTSDQLHYLECKIDDDNFANLIYVDKDVTVNGTYSSSITHIYNNVRLYKGWNYLVFSESGTTVTFTASNTLPSGFKWVVE
jgi:hypothetical protein